MVVQVQVFKEQLVEKYRPKSKSDLIGNEEAVKKVFDFLSNWKPGDKLKSLLLVGPPGTGKTSSVYAIANDLGYDVVEFNASDTRRKNEINETVLPISKFGSIDGEVKRVILLDEIDGLSGQKDRGAVPAIKKLISDSNYPVLLCANDPESRYVEALAKSAPLVVFTRPDEFTIFDLLESIVEKEKLKVDEITLQIISEMSAGDIRAALNELEAAAVGKDRGYIPAKRDKMRILLDYFNNFFQSKTPEEAKKAWEGAPSDYALILNFLVDLTSSQCKNKHEIANAYRVLAYADLIFTRIIWTQNWGLLRFFFDMIGPELRRSIEVRRTPRIKRLNNLPNSYFARGRSKTVNKLAWELSEEVAHKLHLGKNTFVFREFPYFLKIMKGKTGANVLASLDVSEELVQKIVRTTGSNEILKFIEESRRDIGLTRVKDQNESIKPEEDVVQGLLDRFLIDETKPSEIESTSKKKQEDVKDQQTLDSFF